MRRFLLSVLGCSVAVGVVASPAAACGGLVAPNGAVRLAQTSTLAAYHDGVEHYVTSFVYQGAQGSFGSIIPPWLDIAETSLDDALDVRHREVTDNCRYRRMHGRGIEPR